MVFNLALSPLPTGGCLSEVSSGSVPGQASFFGPHYAGVCCCVGHSCWILPAACGAYLPGCSCGSHFTGRYPARLFTPLENDSVGSIVFIWQLLLVWKIPVLEKLQWPRQIIRVVKRWTLKSTLESCLHQHNFGQVIYRFWTSNSSYVEWGWYNCVKALFKDWNS